MALRAPNPRLGTEAITVVTRTKTDGTSGDQSFTPPAGVDYPYAVVTMQRINHEGLRNRSGRTLAEALWDVLIFTTNDPAVKPQLSQIIVAGQGRTLVAMLPSTKREAGCWYVLAQTIE